MNYGLSNGVCYFWMLSSYFVMWMRGISVMLKCHGICGCTFGTVLLDHFGLPQKGVIASDSRLVISKAGLLASGTGKCSCMTRLKPGDRLLCSSVSHYLAKIESWCLGGLSMGMM